MWLSSGEVKAELRASFSDYLDLHDYAATLIKWNKLLVAGQEYHPDVIGRSFVRLRGHVIITINMAWNTLMRSYVGHLYDYKARDHREEYGLKYPHDVIGRSFVRLRGHVITERNMARIIILTVLDTGYTRTTYFRRL